MSFLSTLIAELCIAHRQGGPRQCLATISRQGRQALGMVSGALEVGAVDSLLNGWAVVCVKSDKHRTLIWRVLGTAVSGAVEHCQLWREERRRNKFQVLGCSGDSEALVACRAVPPSHSCMVSF